MMISVKFSEDLVTYFNTDDTMMDPMNTLPALTDDFVFTVDPKEPMEDYDYVAAEANLLHGKFVFSCRFIFTLCSCSELQDLFLPLHKSEIKLEY